MRSVWILALCLGISASSLNCSRGSGSQEATTRVASIESPAPTTAASPTSVPKLQFEWTSTGPTLTPHVSQEAVRLSDGRVMVIGGFTSLDFSPTSSRVEAFDEVTNAWERLADMNYGRVNHVAFVLKDGRVLVVGGGRQDAQATAEVWDVKTGRWSLTGRLLFPSYNSCGAGLPDGRVVVVGGATASGATDGAQVFDPALNEWAAFPAPTLARFGCRLYYVGQTGTLRLVGGQTSGVVQGNDGFEEFDFQTRSWSQREGFAAGGGGYLTAAVADDGTIAFVGGLLTRGTGGQFGQRQVVQLLAQDGSSSLLPLMPEGRYYSTAIVVPDALIVVGGIKGGPDDDLNNATTATSSLAG